MDREERLAKALKRVKIAERLRMVLLFPCLFIVLFMFYGEKFCAGTEWFEGTKMPLYNVLFFAVIFMFILSVLRIFFAKAYNDIVRDNK